MENVKIFNEAKKISLRKSKYTCQMVRDLSTFLYQSIMNITQY